MFTIEFNTMQRYTYTCPDRDALLASVLDGARGNKNRDICVQGVKTNTGARIGPLYLPVEEVYYNLFSLISGTGFTSSEYPVVC